MSFVVGTAGHIDHGKSTLITALTGIDPDRLAEEKRRGMTIDLGFAHLRLPSGREVGIVDVPGHARFIRNMLAGVHGLDAVILVVAADEGVRPQTREHLEIVDLLEVKRGVVALTKIDLVDDQWRALVTEEIKAAIEATSLTDAPIIGVSAVTGQGCGWARQPEDEAVAGRRGDRSVEVQLDPALGAGVDGIALQHYGAGAHLHSSRVQCQLGAVTQRPRRIGKHPHSRVHPPC